ncbi:MAG: HIT domain-containing protein [Sedimentisphaerales bacterium]|nr:HIT domain-containing protein [Sedimentisphaerales bacterium]
MERDNLWAPWRIKYVQGLDNKSQPGKNNDPNSEQGKCFICHNLDHPEQDGENLVLWRTDKSLVILNRFPYNNGHILIAPARHIPDLEQAADDELLEMTKLIRESQKALSLAIKPHGFNVGMNFSRCAGAGLPGHLHIHIVPRWDGDTNFMSVCSDTKVISQSLTELLEILRQVSKEHNLPNL